jgi:hypothetical protein
MLDTIHIAKEFEGAARVGILQMEGVRVTESPQELKAGYDWSYRAFYEWSAIVKASAAHQSLKHSLKHFAYSAGWKKFEPAWDFVIRLKQLSQMRPMLEAVLSRVQNEPKGSLPHVRSSPQGHAQIVISERTPGTVEGYRSGSSSALPQAFPPSTAAAQTR